LEFKEVEVDLEMKIIQEMKKEEVEDMEK